MLCRDGNAVGHLFFITLFIPPLPPLQPLRHPRPRLLDLTQKDDDKRGDRHGEVSEHLRRTLQNCAS